MNFLVLSPEQTSGVGVEEQLNNLGEMRVSLKRASSNLNFLARS